MIDFNPICIHALRQDDLGDAELFHRILNGYGDAFSVLHAKYKIRLFSYVFKRVGNQEDA